MRYDPAGCYGGRSSLDRRNSKNYEFWPKLPERRNSGNSGFRRNSGSAVTNSQAPPNPPCRSRPRFLLMFVLIFFLGPECDDLHPAHAHLLVASPPSFFSVLYLDAHSICLLFLPPPSPVCVAPVVQQSPRGPFYFVPSCAFFPCSCPCICPTHSPSFSCPSHGDNGNARLRFFTAGSGEKKTATTAQKLVDKT